MDGQGRKRTRKSRQMVGNSRTGTVGRTMTVGPTRMVGRTLTVRPTRTATDGRTGGMDEHGQRWLDFNGPGWMRTKMD